MANKITNKKYIDFVKELPCCHCKKYAVDPHHVIGAGMGKMGGTADDIHAVPLCRQHHNEVHDDPNAWPQFRWLMETQTAAQLAGVL